jgi:predicted transcriptional regulator
MDDQTTSPPPDFLGLTADLIAAYVANNSVPASELPDLMAKVHASLNGLTSAGSVKPEKPEPLTPAQVRKSITPDALISFEDGKPYKTLRRHLTLRGLTPEAYREKWGLPADYPMTSASYSAQRSELARSLGLGLQRRKSSPVTEGDETTQDDGAPAKRRGRPPKTVEAVEAVDEASAEA